MELFCEPEKQNMPSKQRKNLHKKIKKKIATFLLGQPQHEFLK